LRGVPLESAFVGVIYLLDQYRFHEDSAICQCRVCLRQLERGDTDSLSV